MLCRWPCCLLLLLLLPAHSPETSTASCRAVVPEDSCLLLPQPKSESVAWRGGQVHHVLIWFDDQSADAWEAPRYRRRRCIGGGMAGRAPQAEFTGRWIYNRWRLMLYRSATRIERTEGAWPRQAGAALISGALQQGLQHRREGLTALMEWYAEHWRAAGGPVRPCQAGPPRAAAALAAAPAERNRRRGSLACVSVCVSIARQDYREAEQTAMGVL